MPLQENYIHPGGIQVIGDFLLVPATGVDYDEGVARVFLYDLTSLNSGTTPRVHNILTFSSDSAASVGITDVSTDKLYRFPNDTDPLPLLPESFEFYKYIMGVYDYDAEKLLLYRPNITWYLDGQGLSAFFYSPVTYDYGFDKIGEIGMSGKKYDNMALLRDTNGDVWMVGLRGEPIDWTGGLTGFTNYVDLYKLTYDSVSSNDKLFYNAVVPTVTKILRITYSARANMWDVSVRYGSGIIVINDRNEFLITATERNLGKHNSVQMNEFRNF